MTLSGELDIATAPRVQEAVDALLADGTRRVTIDLSALDFVDSSGLRLCVVLNQRASAEGWTLAFIRPRAQVAAVFRVSGVEQTLSFVGDIDTGDASAA